MGKKGPRTTQKRISAGTAAQLKRKAHTWTFKTVPGTHSSQSAMAIGMLIRDHLQIANTAKEAKYLVNHGDIKIDGKIRKKIQFPVGLFDVISVGDKHYRIVVDWKGRLVPTETTDKNAGFKLCKIVSKHAAGKKGFVFNTNDGRTVTDKNNKIKPGDTVKISVPKQEIQEHLSLAKGNTVLVTGGKRAASIATIEGIVEGTISRKRLVDLRVEKEDTFQTVDTNVFVVGKDKPIVEVTLNE